MEAKLTIARNKNLVCNVKMLPNILGLFLTRKQLKIRPGKSGKNQRIRFWEFAGQWTPCVQVSKKMVACLNENAFLLR